MDYTSNFVTKIQKKFETPTITAIIGEKENFNVAFLDFKESWKLEDMHEALWGIKRMNLKIDIFVHIYHGSPFPKLSDINQFDWPTEVYNNVYSIMVGLKNRESFMAEAAKKVSDIHNKMFHCKSIEQAQDIVDNLIKESILS